MKVFLFDVLSNLPRFTWGGQHSIWGRRSWGSFFVFSQIKWDKPQVFSRLIFVRSRSWAVHPLQRNFHLSEKKNNEMYLTPASEKRLSSSEKSPQFEGNVAWFAICLWWLVSKENLSLKILLLLKIFWNSRNRSENNLLSNLPFVCFRIFILLNVVL